MDLEGIMLSEINQIKGKNHMISLTWTIKPKSNNPTNEAKQEQMHSCRNQNGGPQRKRGGERKK